MNRFKQFDNDKNVNNSLFHQIWYFIIQPPPDKFKFTINRDSKREIGENYQQVHNTEGEKQRVEHIAHFPWNGMWHDIKGILRRIVLLTQHHDADEVADDTETACDESDGSTDDWDDIVIIRSLIICPTGLLDEFCEFKSEYKF